MINLHDRCKKHREESGMFIPTNQDVSLAEAISRHPHLRITFRNLPSSPSAFTPISIPGRRVPVLLSG